MSPSEHATESVSQIVGLDHVAIPMRDTEAMAAFYRALGFDLTENEYLMVVHAGNQMINFHRPEIWQKSSVTLRAPAAIPPCGDLCFVWGGQTDALLARLADADVEIIEGPVERVGGRRLTASSVYVRDPDGNLVEFMVYS